eukprot:342128_1
MQDITMSVNKQCLIEHEEDIFAVPFIPQSQSDICWHDEAVKDSYRNLKVRITRACSTIIGPILLLIWTTYTSVSVGFVIGFGLLFMFITYFITILRLATGNGNLYRVYSISKKPNEWAANENISYIQLLYHKQSIQSISELSAIYGGVTKTMLNTLGAYTWTAIICHYAALAKWQSDFGWDVADISMIIGCIGLLLISIFELDPFNNKMVFLHYLGALCGCGTIIGFILQQYSLYPNTYFYVSLCIGIIGAIAFNAWQIIGRATDLCQLPKKTQKGGSKYNCILTPLAALLIPNYKNITLNTYSRLNICSEALFLFLGALCLCLFLMNYENVCRFGCSSH